jgi:hypothetical protein
MKWMDKKRMIFIRKPEKVFPYFLSENCHNCRCGTRMIQKQETRDKLTQIEKKNEDLEAENARLKDELGRFDKILDELAELDQS